MPVITAPTAAEICDKSNPSAESMALLKPGMTPAEYFNELEKNKKSVDSVNFLAHGLPEKDSICWSAQSCRLTGPKLSGPEMECLVLCEAWLKNPIPSLHAKVAASLGKIDFTGPGGWTAQAVAWMKIPGAPPLPPMPNIPGLPHAPKVELVAAAVAGAIMLAAGLKIGAPMPAVPKPKLEIPKMPPTPEMLASLQMPKIPKMPEMPSIPPIDQPKMFKMLLPFIDLGKGVAGGTVKCC